jgi:hypothetical protein
MVHRPQQYCGLKKCSNLLGPGAADVGFENEGRTDNVRVCSDHAYILMIAPRGSYIITPDRELKPVPASPVYFFGKDKK